MMLEIIQPGLHTTVQDRGRDGFRDSGIPASGPLDRISLRLANVLVGNDAGAPALEMLLIGPAVRVDADSVRIALVGCSAGIEVEGRKAVVPAGQSVRLSRGDVFRVGPLGNSVCSYLAVEGGIQVTPVLGSASTYVRGNIGGFEGRRLQPRDRLPLKQDRVQMRQERTLVRPMDLLLEQPIRVILGPQADYFTGEAIDCLLSADYTISPQSDRMGYRLSGPALTHSKGYNIVSDGIVTGAIQVPGSGQPIVLMMDNPTTGGYPKIATVISADVPVIARRSPGRKIRFTAVDVQQAEQLRRQQEEWFLQELSEIRNV
jgi:allophanate hydrolase